MTILGRFVGIICTYWGVLVSSVMVVVLTNLFEINNSKFLFKIRIKESIDDSINP